MPCATVFFCFWFYKLMVSPSNLQQSDSEIFNLIQLETQRQEYGLEMIPSENFVSEAVLEACGSILTNKYAEGCQPKDIMADAV